MPETKETPKQTDALDVNAHSIPLAILGAGLLIAAAIYFGGSDRGVQPSNNSFSSFTEALTALAAEQDVDEEAFEKCLASDEFVEDVEQDETGGTAAGATGTPYSVLIAPDGQRFAISGALPYEQVKQKIDAALSGQPGDPQDSAVYTMAPVSADDHIRGNAEAEVVVVEYSDFDCPFCKQFHPTLERIVNDYDGRVAWVYRHMPLEQLHPNAPELAEASECIAQLEGNDAFWGFADRYFSITR